MPKKTSTFIIALIGLSAILLSVQVALPRATADAVTTLSPGSSFSWSVRSSNGDVYWYNNTWSFEGVKTLKTDGTITYNLTGQTLDDNAYSPFSSTVWYGDFGIYHPVGGTQVLNWSKAGCSTTEIGMNLALSALSWCGGLVAPTDWVENQQIILAQTADKVSYQSIGNQAFIHYEYSGQVTDLLYDMPTGVLMYANTTMGGFWLEIAFDGDASSAAIPGPEPILIGLISTLVIATMITRINKSGKKV